MNPEVVITGDGSSTLLHSGTGEHYHSVHGAVAESMHVFIECGLQQTDPATDPLNILEVGFGTGLNALLTLLGTLGNPRYVRYDAIEPFPLPPAVIRSLNYPDILPGQAVRASFERLHEIPTGTAVKVAEHFSLTRLTAKLGDILLPDGTYHLIYFDAFSPNVQPELWEPAVFRKLIASMKPGGMLLTYCAKGLAARSMKEAGFIVEKLAGPPGKRHMLRARAGRSG